jgi:glycosyltransferase involved in cell wall biosynthesis
VRILLLSQFFPPVVGGEERHVFNLARRLAETHEVAVATYGETTATTDRDGLRVHMIRPGTAALPFLYGEGDRRYAPPTPDPVVTLALHRIMREVRPDVIHAHNWIVNSLVPLRRTTAAPIVLTLHDYSHVCATKRLMHLDVTPCSGPAVQKCARCVWHHYKGAVGAVTLAGNQVTSLARQRTVDRFLAVSTAVADGNHLASAGVPFEVVPNFIPDELLATSPVTPPAGFASGDYLVFVGDLSRDKGVDVLLDAYSRLPADRLPLLLIGRRTADSPARFPAGVTVAPPADHPKVMQAFANTAAAVVPSVWPDPCPTVVLEAMAAGRPVVTTPMGGIADMVTDEIEGLVVPPSDPAALAAALVRLVAEPELGTKFGAAARARAAQFTTDRVVPRIEAVYRELIDVRRH